MARTLRQIRKKGKPMAPVALATVAEVDARIVLIQAPIRWASRPSTPSCSVSWSPWSASATLAQAGSRAWCAGRPSRVDLLGGSEAADHGGSRARPPAQSGSALWPPISSSKCRGSSTRRSCNGCSLYLTEKPVFFGYLPCSTSRRPVCTWSISSCCSGCWTGPSTPACRSS